MLHVSDVQGRKGMRRPARALKKIKIILYIISYSQNMFSFSVHLSVNISTKC